MNQANKNQIKLFYKKIKILIICCFAAENCKPLFLKSYFLAINCIEKQ